MSISKYVDGNPLLNTGNTVLLSSFSSPSNTFVSLTELDEAQSYLLTGSTGGVLVIDKSISVNSSFTHDPRVVLRFQQGKTFSISSGIATFYGDKIESPSSLDQIFFGSGSYSIINSLRVSWFDSVSTACSSVFLSSFCDFIFDKDVIVSSDCSVPIDTRFIINAAVVITINAGITFTVSSRDVIIPKDLLSPVFSCVGTGSVIIGSLENFYAHWINGSKNTAHIERALVSVGSVGTVTLAGAGITWTLDYDLTVPVNKHLHLEDYCIFNGTGFNVNVLGTFTYGVGVVTDYLNRISKGYYLDPSTSLEIGGTNANDTYFFKCTTLAPEVKLLDGFYQGQKLRIFVECDGAGLAIIYNSVTQITSVGITLGSYVSSPGNYFLFTNPNKYLIELTWFFGRWYVTLSI
jgi:hypothetical protein